MQDLTILNMDPQAVRQALIYKDNNPQWVHLPLRIYLAGKGCDGFNYGVSFDDPLEGDLHFCFSDPERNENIDVVIDPETLKFVQTSTVTWVDDERGKGFLVENPQHKKFRGKFFKRAGWEGRLLSSREPKPATDGTLLEADSV